jgi:capsular polysaccharide biosynthesis protein
MATKAAAAASSGGTYRVTVSSDPSVPIIEVHAAAPDAATATRLAVAVRGELEDIVHERTGARPVVTIERLGPVAARTMVSAPRKAVALVAFAMVLVFWVFSAVVLVGFMRRGRAPKGAGRVRRHPASA